VGLFANEDQARAGGTPCQQPLQNAWNTSGNANCVPLKPTMNRIGNFFYKTRSSGRARRRQRVRNQSICPSCRLKSRQLFNEKWRVEPAFHVSTTKRNLARRTNADCMRGGCQIDMPARHKRPTIIDAYNDAAVMADLNSRAERQGATCNSSVRH
jgi:hypothetical protein